MPCSSLPKKSYLDGSTYFSYELNLVRQDGSRIYVVDHGSKSAMRKDAGTLAAFLGKPLWDAADMRIPDQGMLDLTKTLSTICDMESARPSGPQDKEARKALRNKQLAIALQSKSLLDAADMKAQDPDVLAKTLSTICDMEARHPGLLDEKSRKNLDKLKAKQQAIQ